MRRTFAHAVFVVLLSGLATVVGVVTSMTLTNAGRDLVARLASLEIDGIIRGDLTIGRVAGNFLRTLRLEDVVIRDSTGDLVATVPAIRLRYRLPQLLAGQVVLTGIQLDRPTVHLKKKASGRLNLEDVLRLGEGPGGGRSPLVEFRNVRIIGGTVTIDLPWTPPDTAQTGARLAAALASERAKPGRVIVAGEGGGFRRFITIDGLTTSFPLVVVSTPDRQPLTVDVEALAARISDPRVTLHDAVGRIQVPGDSLVFSFERVALANTVAIGGGVVRWSDGEEFYDFTFTAEQADLADFDWVSPDLPAMTGTALLAARTESAERTAFVLRDLDLTGPAGARAAGTMTILQDERRGIGFRDLRLQTTRLDLDAIRPFLDTIPFYGTITGTTVLDGFVDGFTGMVDWEFRDATHDSVPTTLLVAEGRFRGDPEAGLVFDSVTVTRADVDLRTVRRLAPAVTLEGRLEASGLLDGPLRDATFDGAMAHHDGAGPVSAARGRVRLDSRGEDLAVAVDVTIDSLTFAGIRRGFPDLPSRGRVAGHLAMTGTLGSMDVDTDLHGDLGRVRVVGRAALLPERLGGRDLSLEFSDLDLAALLGTGPATRLNGTASVNGFVGAEVAGAGALRVRLGPSSVREFALDTVVADVSLADSLITVDSMAVQWPRGGITGTGTLGQALPYRGRMSLALRIDSLGVFDTLAVNALGITRDTVDWHPLGGVLEATLDVRGALDALTATGTLTAVDLAFGRGAVPHMRGSLAVATGTRTSMALTTTMDTLEYGTLAYPRVQFQIQGRPDSLAWSGAAALGGTTRLDLAGRRVVGDSAETWYIDRFAAGLVEKEWRLQRPVEVVLRDSSVTLTLVDLVAADGSGFVALTPHDGGRTLTLEALGVGIRDLYGVVQRDTTEVSGSISANLELGGTRRAPTITGTVQASDVTLEGFRGPLGRAIVHYENGVLEANLLLWRTGQPVLRVESSLPYDLGLTAVEDRRLLGPLQVRAVADSVDLGVLDAFSRSIQQVRGNLFADVQVEGTWEDPRLTGTVRIANARARVPGLGVAFRDIRGRAHMVGDTVVIDTLRIEGETGGSADFGGWVRMENLTEPVLNVVASANDFLIIDVREYLTLAASGSVQLSGPFWQPTLTGGVTANRGILYFADLVNKQVVDLEDPANADLVDLDVIRERRLGADFQNRFLDSLRIDNLDLRVRDNFWLRSSEANIGLEGQLRVNKVRREYRLDGELKALRGNYALRLGNLVTRNFTVLRGDVRYFGTPDLDAQVDIEAEHRVTTVDRGEQIPIIAHITGTLQAPQLELYNTNGPPISESDLVSYLVLGRPGPDFGGVGTGAGTQEPGALAFGTSALFSTLTSEVERALISDVGLPIDYVAIRPGSGSLLGTSASATRIAAGWRLTRAVFVTLSAGFCPNDQLLNYKALGASLEWRFGLRWRSSVSVEPVDSCDLSSQADVLQSARYQIGVDLLWENEF